MIGVERRLPHGWQKGLAALLCAAALGLLSACQHGSARSDVPALQLARLPDVAAAYRTTRELNAHGERQSTRLDWRVYRDAEAGRIELEDLGSRTGELWQRDGGTLFFLKLFHDDRRAVEYRSDDLAVLDIGGDWQAHALLIDPQWLQDLPVVASGWREGYPYQRRRGELHGEKIDLVWRLDLNLPVSIERSGEGYREVTELAEVHAAATAPWPRRDSAAYEVIDFADLGDRESDPFVQRIFAQLPGERPHSH